MPLPNRLANQFPDEMVGIPLEDLDPFYYNKRVSTHTSNTIIIFTSIVYTSPLLSGNTSVKRGHDFLYVYTFLSAHKA